MMRTPDSAPRHAAIVLAAGRSTRLGQPKQLLIVHGETLLRRAVRFALETAPAEVIVVLDPSAEAMRDQLDGLACRALVCAHAQQGMAASLRCGLSALDARCDGALIVLTDQPALDGQHLRALVARWQQDPRAAAASGYAGTIGVPAVLPRAWFDSLLDGDGDHGARDLLRTRRDQVRVIDAAALALDLDSAADLERWKPPPT